jgi:hypothetical protein
LNPFLNVQPPQTLLIIAPDAFMQALQPLVAHKKATGMPAMTVSISSLTGFFPGVDDPEAIKSGIAYAHKNLATRYVMLVGDAHQFPVRFYFMHRLTGESALSNWASTTNPDGPTVVVQPYGDWIPSDLYYANLYHHTGIYPTVVTGPFDNWDANGNGLYNEMTWIDNNNPNPDNVDGYPDVTVGRIPAHSVADVTAFVNKVIAYESSTNRGPIPFTFVADEQYDPHNQGTKQQPHYVGSDATDFTASVYANSALKRASPTFLLIENTGTGFGFLPSDLPWKNASATDVANAANVSIWVSYIGHGGPYPGTPASNASWGEWGTFGVNDVKGTASSKTLPVVFAAGCSTGRFVSDLPWNASYMDTSGNPAAQQGNHGPFQVLTTAKPGIDGPVIVDTSTGKNWGVNCPPPGCSPLPAMLPYPNAYDFDEGDQGFAYPWLIANAPGGAIAYFGEVSVATDIMGAELETYFLTLYGNESSPILGDIYLRAQQQYWGAHQNDNGGQVGDFHSISRCYLGWITFFGDPSLRLPSLQDPCAEQQAALDNYSAGDYATEAEAKQAFIEISHQLLECRKKYG